MKNIHFSVFLGELGENGSCISWRNLEGIPKDGQSWRTRWKTIWDSIFILWRREDIMFHERGESYYSNGNPNSCNDLRILFKEIGPFICSLSEGSHIFNRRNQGLLFEWFCSSAIWTTDDFFSTFQPNRGNRVIRLFCGPLIAAALLRNSVRGKKSRPREQYRSDRIWSKGGKKFVRLRLKSHTKTGQTFFHPLINQPLKLQLNKFSTWVSFMRIIFRRSKLKQFHKSLIARVNILIITTSIRFHKETFGPPTIRTSVFFGLTHHNQRFEQNRLLLLDRGKSD